MDWALQDAKSRFSEVVRRARSDGPQHVTVRGEPSVVVISEQDFMALKARSVKAGDVHAETCLLSGPTWPDWFADLVDEREKDDGRPIGL